MFLTIYSPAFCGRLFLEEHLSITFVKVALNVIHESEPYLIFKNENVFSWFKGVFGLSMLLMRIRSSYMENACFRIKRALLT